MHHLNNFRGDLQAIIDYERQRGVGIWRAEGQPYVLPGTRGGISLDVGFDLSTDSFEIVDSIYADYIDEQERRALLRARGIRGLEAQLYLQHDQVLMEIRIPEEAASKAFMEVIPPIWRQVLVRWPQIVRADCPASVHTALLDIVWCRGVMNKHLKPLDFPIRRGRFDLLVDALADMQQRSADKEMKERRHFFANLVREEIEVESESEQETA